MQTKAGGNKIDYTNKQAQLQGYFNKQYADLDIEIEKVDGTSSGNSGQTPPNGNAYGQGNGNGGNVNGNGNGNNVEAFVFYYHPDHLGSSSYISDANGEVTQHLEYFAFGETFLEEHSNTESTPYLFNGKELDEETGLYYYGARYYDAKTSIWQSVDPLAEKYPNVSPYTYCLNNPINAVDPDGRDVIFLVWASHDGKIGHAGVAVSNYKQISERVKVNGKWKMQTKMVADGTYTYRDLWLGGAGAGKDNFDKDVPAVYNNKIVTLDQLMTTDVTGSEGYIADGIVKVTSGQTNDETLMMDLDAFEKSNPSYNGLDWNCSDYVEEAMEWTAGKQMPVDEKLTDNKSATTPNKIFKAAKSMPNSTVLKNPGTKVNSGFIQAVTGGGAKQKIAEKKLD